MYSISFTCDSIKPILYFVQIAMNERENSTTINIYVYI